MIDSNIAGKGRSDGAKRRAKRERAKKARGRGLRAQGRSVHSALCRKAYAGTGFSRFPRTGFREKRSATNSSGKAKSGEDKRGDTKRREPKGKTRRRRGRIKKNKEETNAGKTLFRQIFHRAMRVRWKKERANPCGVARERVGKRKSRGDEPRQAKRN